VIGTSGMRTSGLLLFTVIEDSLEKGRRLCAVCHRPPILPERAR